MPIMFEEAVQAVINLVRENEQVKAYVKKLEAEIVELKKSVREPDNKPVLKEVK